MIKPEEQFILSGARIEPFQPDIDRMNDLISKISDWNYLAILAINNGMAPLVSKKIPLLENNHLIPPEIKEQLHQAYLRTLSRNLVIYEHFRNVALALNEAGIPVIALKGIHLSETLYKDIGLRQLSDMDLLVKEEDTADCLELLKSSGYAPLAGKTRFIEQNADCHHLSPMIKNGVSVEVHTKLHKEIEAYQVKTADLWNNTERAEINGAGISVLAPNHLLIHLCLHLDKHFVSAKVQFTCYTDITNILGIYEKETDWEGLEKLCDEYNCIESFFKHIILSAKFFNAPVPDNILNKYDTACTASDENNFISCLRRERPLNKSRQNIQIMQQFDGLVSKLKYILHDTFPSRGYMMWRYGISSRYMVIFYYPYRILLGFRQFAVHILGKISAKF